MKSKWLVLFLIWLMMLVAYFDRINMPAASTAIMASLHLTKTQFGLVLSAFTLGYAFMQAPGGHLADKLGSRRLLIAAIVVWSIFTGFTGAATSLAMLIGIRIVFGVGEGLENGAQFKLVGEYFAPKERALANSIFLSALALGPAIGVPTATWLVEDYGWRTMFYVFAGIGFVVALVLVVLLPRDQPSPAIAPQASVMQPGTGSEVSNVEAEREGMAAVVRLPSTWLCALGYLLFNMAFWGFLSWVPTYLREDRHIPLAKSGLLGALPYLAALVGMIVIGWLGSTVFHARRALVVSGCYIGAGAGLLLALSASGTASCVAGLCVAGLFLYSVFGPFWAIAIDLAPPKARGLFTGSVNCCGQVGAFTSQIVIGMLADKMKSFAGAIMFMTGALVLGAIVMVTLQRTTHSGGRANG